MSDFDSSGLSSPPSDIEEPVVVRKTLTLKHGKLAATPTLIKSKSLTPPESLSRESTPDREHVLADNPDIPILVAFRARFSDAFPKNVLSFGPQDLEQGVVESVPGEQIENLLCALLSLVLNRKKTVERGHHGRALEEAVQTQKHQWPDSWNGINPLHNARTFQIMDPTSRLNLLKTLMLWSLNTSDAVTTIIKDSYRQARHEDDLNQPLSVQSWGADGRKRKYWLIEGQNDTSFRLYMENLTKPIGRRWWNVAGTLEELRAVAKDLRLEGSQAARRLADKIEGALPRLEATEEKRKRREYRLARRAAFIRPEPGFSLYEGRTRGKRMKYTYSDDENDGEDDEGYDSASRQSTIKPDFSPMDGISAPIITASGRQVKSRYRRPYSGQEEFNDPSSSEVNLHRDGRVRRSARRSSVKMGRLADHMSLDEDTGSSETVWDGNGDIEETYYEELDDQSTDESSDVIETHPKSLVVHLKYPRKPSDEAMSINSKTHFESSNSNQLIHRDSKSLEATNKLSNQDIYSFTTGKSKGKGSIVQVARPLEPAILTDQNSIHISSRMPHESPSILSKNFSENGTSGEETRNQHEFLTTQSNSQDHDLTVQDVSLKPLSHKYAALEERSIFDKPEQNPAK